jgi:hypothetical protein
LGFGEPANAQAIGKAPSCIPQPTGPTVGVFCESWTERGPYPSCGPRSYHPPLKVPPSRCVVLPTGRRPSWPAVSCTVYYNTSPQSSARPLRQSWSRQGEIGLTDERHTSEVVIGGVRSNMMRPYER